jgi:hypothetical protein
VIKYLAAQRNIEMRCADRRHPHPGSVPMVILTLLGTAMLEATTHLASPPRVAKTQ